MALSLRRTLTGFVHQPGEQQQPADDYPIIEQANLTEPPGGGDLLRAMSIALASQLGLPLPPSIDDDDISQRAAGRRLWRPPKEFWRTLKQNRLVVYICGATNTAELLSAWSPTETVAAPGGGGGGELERRKQPDKSQALRGALPAGLLSAKQRDKLAQIRPLFRAILLRANSKYPAEIHQSDPRNFPFPPQSKGILIR